MEEVFIGKMSEKIIKNQVPDIYHFSSLTPNQYRMVISSRQSLSKQSDKFSQLQLRNDILQSQQSSNQNLFSRQLSNLKHERYKGQSIESLQIKIKSSIPNKKHLKSQQAQLVAQTPYSRQIKTEQQNNSMMQNWNPLHFASPQEFQSNIEQIHYSLKNLSKELIFFKKHDPFKNLPVEQKKKKPEQLNMLQIDENIQNLNDENQFNSNEKSLILPQIQKKHQINIKNVMQNLNIQTPYKSYQQYQYGEEIDEEDKNTQQNQFYDNGMPVLYQKSLNSSSIFKNKSTQNLQQLHFDQQNPPKEQLQNNDHSQIRQQYQIQSQQSTNRKLPFRYLAQKLSEMDKKQSIQSTQESRKIQQNFENQRQSLSNENNILIQKQQPSYRENTSQNQLNQEYYDKFENSQIDDKLEQTNIEQEQNQDEYNDEQENFDEGDEQIEQENKGKQKINEKNNEEILEEQQAIDEIFKDSSPLKKSDKIQKNKLPPYMNIQTTALVFKSKVIEIIQKDPDFRKLLKYYCSEKDFVNFVSKLLRYSLQYALKGPEEALNDFGTVLIGDAIRIKFTYIAEDVLKLQEMPMEKINETISQFSQQWNLIIRNINIVEEIGGEHRSNDIAKKTFIKFLQLNTLEQDQYEQYISVAQELMLLILNSNQKKSQELLKVKIQVLKKEFFKTHNISNEEFFLFKKILWEQINSINQIGLESKLKVIEKFERLRYSEFAEIFALQNLDLTELSKTLLFFFKAKPGIQSYFGGVFLKDKMYQLAKYLVSYVFQYESAKVCAEFLVQISTKKPDNLLIHMIEICFKDAVKRYGGIDQLVFYEIENKFFWIKLKSGVKADQFWLFQKLRLVIDKIIEWSVKMQKANQLPKNIKVQELIKIDFLEYFLYSSLAGGLSVHDIMPGLKIYNVKQEVFLIWLKGIKRILFVYMKLPPEQVFDIYNYFECLYKNGLQ